MEEVISRYVMSVDTVDMRSVMLSCCYASLCSAVELIRAHTI